MLFASQSIDQVETRTLIMKNASNLRNHLSIILKYYFCICLIFHLFVRFSCDRFALQSRNASTFGSASSLLSLLSLSPSMAAGFDCACDLCLAIVCRTSSFFFSKFNTLQVHRTEMELLIQLYEGIQ